MIVSLCAKENLNYDQAILQSLKLLQLKKIVVTGKFVYSTKAKTNIKGEE